MTCQRIGLRIQGASEHELAGRHSECSDRLRKSKEKAEEIGENDGICSEMGDTAGQDRDVEGFSACESWSLGEVDQIHAYLD